jgi:hypothetical protein
MKMRTKMSRFRGEGLKINYSPFYAKNVNMVNRVNSG